MIFFDSIHFCHRGRGFVALLRSSMDLFCDNHVANARFPTAIPIQRDSVSIAKVGEELEKKHAGAHHSSQIENLSLSSRPLFGSWTTLDVLILIGSRPAFSRSETIAFVSSV
jgi:hypothetical protein